MRQGHSSIRRAALVYLTALASIAGCRSFSAGGNTNHDGTTASGGQTLPVSDTRPSSGGTGGSGGSGGVAGSGGAAGRCPASATAKPGDSTKTITVGTLRRSYLVRIPASYTGTTPVPVVLDFHGLGESGSSQKSSSGWAALADSKGFIGVWPEGTGTGDRKGWNVGRCCSDAQANQVDDVAFVRAIIKQLQGTACIDTKRVYATGCSNGGGMSYMLACNAADAIAAVAPVDFDCVTSPTDPGCGNCRPSRPISATQFRATGDTLVPYDGGSTPVPANCPPGGTCSTFTLPGAQANFKAWASIDQCTGSAVALSGHSMCQTYATCAQGTRVTLCTQQGGDHCGNYASLGIGNIAWEIFQKEAIP